MKGTHGNVLFKVSRARGTPSATKTPNLIESDVIKSGAATRMKKETLYICPHPEIITTDSGVPLYPCPRYTCIRRFLPEQIYSFVVSRRYQPAVVERRERERKEKKRNEERRRRKKKKKRKDRQKSRIEGNKGKPELCKKRKRERERQKQRLGQRWTNRQTGRQRSLVHTFASRRKQQQRQ